MMGILEGHDVAIANWTFQQYQLYPIPINRAIGIMDDDKIVGSALFQHFNGFNIELSFYGPDTLNIGVCRYIADMAFRQMKVSRITVNIPRSNKQLIKGLLKLKAVREGNSRRFYGDSDQSKHTAVRFAFFKEHADRFLRITSMTVH